MEKKKKSEKKSAKENFLNMKKHSKKQSSFVLCFALLALVVKSSMFTPHINMGTMDKTKGVRFLGFSPCPISFSSGAGSSVFGAGDVDGDKVKDFLIGASGVNSLQGGTTAAGQVYVLYGQQNTTAAMGIWGSDFTPLHTHLITSPWSCHRWCCCKHLSWNVSEHSRRF